MLESVTPAATFQQFLEWMFATERFGQQNFGEEIVIQTFYRLNHQLTILSHHWLSTLQ